MINWLRKLCSHFCGCPAPAPVPRPGPGMTQAERATYVRQFLANPMWDEVVSELEREAFTLWKNTHVSDSAAREFLYGHYRALGLIKRRVEGVLANAALEEEMEIKRSKLPQP